MSGALINWYLQNKRELPWRETSDPYKIWLSEIILQQTRVDQGLSYYNRFCEQYPDIYSLSAASVDDVLLLWQGLGYYTRARNMHAAARQIVGEYEGKFPKSPEELLKIMGIGRYTAAAIASFAFKAIVPVVDGNVYRVLTRYFAIKQAIDTAQGKKEIEDLAWNFLNSQLPDIHNQALMELGALICKPLAPKCSDCPLMTDCKAFSMNEQLHYPVKQTKVKVRNRYLYYYIIRCGDCVYIQQRKERDIWQGLYQFPLIENDTVFTELQIISSAKQFVPEGKGIKLIRISDEIKHVLSHQHIFARFIHLEIIDNQIELPEYLKIPVTDLDKFAFPRLITRYAGQNGLF